MTEGLIIFNNQIAVITSWEVDKKTYKLITGMDEGKIITVLNEHEIMIHASRQLNEYEILKCHEKVKQIMNNLVREGKGN